MKRRFLLACLLVWAASVALATPQSFKGVRVVGVSDGDTITVVTSDRQRLRVRLSQIDAPETGQPFGSRSKQSLSAICFGKHAELEVETVDHYGRVVARVNCGGVDAQNHLVVNGMAWVYDRYATDMTLYSLQDAARKARVGIWSQPGAVPPWEFRRNSR